MKRMQPKELRAAVAACGLLAAAPAHANAVFPAPSPALQCLTPQGAAVKPLVYPADAYQRKESGTVSVQLTFTEPGEEPDVKLLNDRRTAHSDLQAAVRDHVRQFRLPCLAHGAAPVLLRQDYVFMPNDGRKVVSTKPREDSGGTARDVCTFDARDSVPAYPQQLVNKDVQGAVLTELRFDALDSAPQVTIAAAPHPVLANSVTYAAQQWRLRCPKPVAATQFPLTYRFVYRFSVANGRTSVLRNTTLKDLVGASEKFPTGVYFDTRTMGCPFDVRLTYYQPTWPNRVEQLEVANPEREPLLDWLELFQLRASKRMNAQLQADSMDVHVPCMVVDL